MDLLVPEWSVLRCQEDAEGAALAFTSGMT